MRPAPPRLLLLIVLLFASSVAAQDRAKLPFRVGSFDRAFNGVVRAEKIAVSAKQTQCLEPRQDAKRAVCSYELGFMTVITIGASRTDNAQELTMICTPKEQGADLVKCLLAYRIAVQIASPQLSKDDRGKLVSALLSSIDVGDEVRIDVGDVRYILQKTGPAGLWFHAQVREG